MLRRSIVFTYKYKEQKKPLNKKYYVFVLYKGQKVTFIFTSVCSNPQKEIHNIQDEPSSQTSATFYKIHFDVFIFLKNWVVFSNFVSIAFHKA